MPITKALRYLEYGQAEEVLKVETLDLPEPTTQQVLIKILAAPINPADIGRIGGTYGNLAPLPATAGMEGVGEIVETGRDVSNYSMGQKVFIPDSIGSWQTHAIANAADLFPAPEKLSTEQSAMAWVNPVTAWKLIHDFAKLQPGDWIVQNAATSAVGKLVIQFASHLGLKTANLVRSLEQSECLKKLGANLVLTDDRDAAKNAAEIMGPNKAKLALNSIGGSSALSMCKLLENASPLVTFGGMDREPAPFPTRYLIFNDIRLLGFWVNHWYKMTPRDEILLAHGKIFNFMENAKINAKVTATYPLEDWKDALAHAQKAGKGGKVLFRP